MKKEFTMQEKMVMWGLWKTPLIFTFVFTHVFTDIGFERTVTDLFRMPSFNLGDDSLMFFMFIAMYLMGIIGGHFLFARKESLLYNARKMQDSETYIMHKYSLALGPFISGMIYGFILSINFKEGAYLFMFQIPMLAAMIWYLPVDQNILSKFYIEEEDSL